jgi:hypothetical protein
MNAIRLSFVTAIVAWGLFAPQALAITGGKVDEKNTYSNVGALVVIRSPFPEDQCPWVTCTGILIHPRVLLTAGHATAFFEAFWAQGIGSPDDLRVSFGVNAYDPATWLEIEGVITHPDFRDPNPKQIANAPFLNDVGVVILKNPVSEDVPLAVLPPVGLLDELKAGGQLREPGEGGTEFTVAGYGRTWDYRPPEEIVADGLRRVAVSEYRALRQGWLYLNQNFATGQGGTAVGDSGGPTLWKDPDTGNDILVSLCSRGDPRCVSNGVTWRVDTSATLDFIEDVIAMVDAGLL